MRGRDANLDFRDELLKIRLRRAHRGHRRDDVVDGYTRGCERRALDRGGTGVEGDGERVGLVVRRRRDGRGESVVHRGHGGRRRGIHGGGQFEHQGSTDRVAGHDGAAGEALDERLLLGDHRACLGDLRGRRRLPLRGSAESSDDLELGIRARELSLFGLE